MPSEHALPSQWFVTEVEPHRTSVRAWLMARFPSVADADNIVQEAMARVYRARVEGPVGSPRALLFATVRNLALDAVRRQRILQLEPFTDAHDSFVVAPEDDVHANLARQEELELLTRAIQSLPERCRRVLTLRTAYGLTQKQIAAQLGVSVSTVEKAMERAVRGCIAFFAEEGETRR